MLTTTAPPRDTLLCDLLKVTQGWPEPRPYVLPLPESAPGLALLWLPVDVAGYDGCIGPMLDRLTAVGWRAEMDSWSTLLVTGRREVR